VFELNHKGIKEINNKRNMDQSMALACFHNNNKFDNKDRSKNKYLVGWLIDLSIECLLDNAIYGLTVVINKVP
jgi:hypothetical protein